MVTPSIDACATRDPLTAQRDRWIAQSVVDVRARCIVHTADTDEAKPVLNNLLVANWKLGRDETKLCCRRCEQAITIILTMRPYVNSRLTPNLWFPRIQWFLLLHKSVLYTVGLSTETWSCSCDACATHWDLYLSVPQATVHWTDCRERSAIRGPLIDRRHD